LERMDGEIGVESKEGKGSRFWFVVPFDSQDVEQTQPEWRMPEIYGMRMLVVDDNETNRIILVKILESFGCEPAAVATGAKGIETLVDAARSGNPYKMVFLDNYMPGMDGEQTAREIKANPEISDVEIVMLTSAKRRGDVSRFDAIGCAGYLVKPVKQSQLYDTIITVLCIGENRKTKKTTIVTRDTALLPRIQKAKILLVEDNPVNQKLAAKLLERVGLHCVVADNGEDALKALSGDRYDLVLMDIQMPVMNGFEATRAIREREGSERHTPIIAMTAHAMQGDRERCLKAGMDDYLSKPLNRKEMFSVIEKWVKASLTDSHPAREKASSKISASRNSPIDLDSALERAGGDREFLNELIETFLEHTPEQINLLDGAAQKGGAESVAGSAHSIKGSAGNLSADSIASLAEVIEKMAKSGDISTISPILEKLKDEVKRLMKHFQAAKQGVTQ
ncbi:MAG: response regulator, partial [Planctomycetota bacterium]